LAALATLSLLTFASAFVGGSDGVVRLSSNAGQAGPVGRFVGIGDGPTLCLGMFCFVVGN
jgi:hypothetical protein